VAGGQGGNRLHDSESSKGFTIREISKAQERNDEVLIGSVFRFGRNI